MEKQRKQQMLLIKKQLDTVRQARKQPPPVERLLEDYKTPSLEPGKRYNTICLLLKYYKREFATLLLVEANQENPLIEKRVVRLSSHTQIDPKHKQ